MNREIGRLGAISAQFVNATLERSIPLLLFVTSACMLTGGLAAYSLPVELVGTSMADTVHDTMPNVDPLSTDKRLLRPNMNDSLNRGNSLLTSSDLMYDSLSITENIMNQSRT